MKLFKKIFENYLLVHIDFEDHYNVFYKHLIHFEYDQLFLFQTRRLKLNLKKNKEN